jgi:hypothetical protein
VAVVQELLGNDGLFGYKLLHVTLPIKDPTRGYERSLHHHGVTISLKMAAGTYRANRMIQITQQTVGELWGFSWLELYLEIYRHHHVTLGFPGSRLAPEIRPSSHAGAWLLTDLATSALAPLLFGVLALLRNRRRTSAASATDVSSEMTFAWTLITAGALLTLLGALNQAIQATPLEVDLTLRHGNGGFMVLGLAILSAGIGARRLSGSRRSMRKG